MDSQQVPVVCPDHFPDSFRRLVEQITDDLALTLPGVHPQLRVEIADNTDRGLLIFTVWFDFVRRAGFGLPLRALTGSVEQLRRDIAARLQDTFVEEYSRPLPPCPGHQHPLVPEVRDVAVWECPYDPGHWSCRIGDYRARG